ncbi:MAG: hypothetical protein IJI74_07065 [Firmicutes bacterium]|nr:hypothetical protein [Bacillota bacterium]
MRSPKTIITAMLTAFLMVFAMMPQIGMGIACAETISAPGGEVSSNSEADAAAAFGASNAAAAYSGGDHTLMITLNEDITLETPVIFKKGKTGDTVVLDLNGHTITGAAGTDGTDQENAKGKDAIRIIPGAFDIEIKGSGSVIGGKGAVFEDEDHFRSGMNGGDAVSFVQHNDGGYWYPYDSVKGELEYGLKIKNGASITGGDGADITGDDWIYNIGNYSGGGAYSMYNCYQFVLRAGNGGAGIGQADTGIPDGATTLAYTRIEVLGGAVTGGAGGSLDMGTGNTPVMTHYGLMTNSVIDTYMQGAYDPSTTYDDYVAASIELDAGQGGDGIMIGAGRKYVLVGEGPTVSGGACGTVDYGKSKLVSRIGNEEVRAGNGIGVYGDIGYTIEDADGEAFLGDWSTKNKDSDDMGIYIAGTVKGGDSPDADAMDERTGEGGDGILMQFEEAYMNTAERDIYGRPVALVFPEPAVDNPIKWGVVKVADTGTVTGGNAGTALCGAGGSGGTGIHEPYTKSNEPTAGVSKIGTDCYLINGTIRGGNGGDSMTAIGGSGNFGAGGNGFSAGNYREDAKIVGNGTASGGDWGSTVDRGDIGSSVEAAEGIRFYPSNVEYYNNTVAITDESGSEPQLMQVDNKGLSVTATMSNFAHYPSTSTKLNAAVTLPAGYNGAVYVHWSAKLKLQQNPAGVFDIEPSGTNNTTFNLLSDEDYKYLMSPSDYLNEYNLDIATTGRIKNIIQYQNSTCSIWCYVALEDGRWAKSNVMKFDKDGWDGKWEDPQQEEEKAAREVAGMIDALYDSDVSELKLSHADAVWQARAAYDALVEADNAYVNIYVDDVLLAKLRNAEARIIDLTAAYEVDRQIVGLVEYLKETKAEEGRTAEQIADAKMTAQAAIEDARTVYDALTDDQKALVSYPDMLVSAENLIAASEDDYQDLLDAFLDEYGTVDLKEANPLEVKGKTYKVKYSKLKKKTKKLKVSKVIRTISPGEGTITYEKSKGKKKITINKKTGKVTIKKGMKRGTYKVIVKVKAAGNDYYLPAEQIVTFRIKIK